jgi:hypothetical protein
MSRSLLAQRLAAKLHLLLARSLALTNIYRFGLYLDLRLLLGLLLNLTAIQAQTTADTIFEAMDHLQQPRQALALI